MDIKQRLRELLKQDALWVDPFHTQRDAVRDALAEIERLEQICYRCGNGAQRCLDVGASIGDMQHAMAAIAEISEFQKLRRRSRGEDS